jgi:hypothetical protein
MLVCVRVEMMLFYDLSPQSNTICESARMLKEEIEEKPAPSLLPGSTFWDRVDKTIRTARSSGRTQQAFTLELIDLVLGTSAELGSYKRHYQQRNGSLDV